MGCIGRSVLNKVLGIGPVELVWGGAAWYLVVGRIMNG